MTVEAIKEAIEHLPAQDRRKLADWFDDVEERSWDAEIERDFAPGGRGEHLVAKVKADIAAGRFRSLEELCSERKQDLS